jgi:DNA polymerase-3 subunit beta
MEIFFNSKMLLQIMKTAAKVINQKSPLPILGDFLFEYKGGGVMIVTSSNGEQWLSQKLNVTSEEEAEFRFCVQTSNLLNTIGNLGDVTVHMSVDKDSNMVCCRYGNGEFSVPYEDAEEYPSPNMNNSDSIDLILNAKKVLKAIETTGYATANDELRPVMNGIHFDFLADGMVCVGADETWLVRYKDKTITREDDGTTPEFTLPKGSANVLMSVLSSVDDDIKITFNKESLFVSNSNFKLSARLLEYRYPNYNAVIPKDSKITITADRVCLINALKRVIPMSNDLSNLVEFDFKQGQLTISASNIDFNKSASETVTCDCDSEIKIGFKGSSVLEVLKNINDDNIVIELSEPNRAGVFYSAFEYTRDEYLSLCMPMQLI